MRTSPTWTQGKPACRATLAVLLCAALTLSGCAVASAPSPRPAADVIGADLAARGFVDSADGSLRVSGKGGLLLSWRPRPLARQVTPPPAPAGWELVGPSSISLRKTVSAGRCSNSLRAWSYASTPRATGH